MNAPQDAPPRSLADRLHSAAIRMLRRLRAQDRAMGLTGPSASALSVVVYGGPLTLGALASAEQVRPPTITRLARGLARRGLVRIETDPADSRRRLVSATAKGRATLEKGRDRRVSALSAALEALPAQSRAELEAAVGVLELMNGPATPWHSRTGGPGNVESPSRVSRRGGPSLKGTQDR